LDHYFTGFQTYIIAEAENERGRFDMRIALEVLSQEAKYKSEGASTQGIFVYQFETLCRNRLRYDRGLQAMAADPVYDDAWREWIGTVSRQIGLIDFADLVYVRSRHYLTRRTSPGNPPPEPEKPLLFGDKEGKIALANRRKDPLYFFAALQRQLGYPKVPRPRLPDQAPELIPQLMRRLERLESRLKLMEDEHREGIDLTRFYSRQGSAEGQVDD
jgi:hypothetical protein